MDFDASLPVRPVIVALKAQLSTLCEGDASTEWRRTTAYSLRLSRRQEGGVGNQGQRQDVDARGAGRASRRGRRHRAVAPVVMTSSTSTIFAPASCLARRGNGEGARHVLAALLTAEAHLRRGALGALQGQGLERQTGKPRDLAAPGWPTD